ncbi:hypothetical protein [Steroidobacter sp.]|nr:hypothetical protein [Steroidobacter sp.]
MSKLTRSAPIANVPNQSDAIAKDTAHAIVRRLVKRRMTATTDHAA